MFLHIFFDVFLAFIETDSAVSSKSLPIITLQDTLDIDSNIFGTKLIDHTVSHKLPWTFDMKSSIIFFSEIDIVRSVASIWFK